MKSSTCLLAISIVAGTLLTCGCNQKRSGGNPQFNSGRSALQKGRYAESVDIFDRFLKEQPRHRLASRASFLAAKAHMGLGKLDEAEKRFEATIQNFGSSEEAHKSRYKLAVVALLKGDRDDALKRFKQLADHPEGTLSPESAAMVRYLSAPPGGE